MNEPTTTTIIFGSDSFDYTRTCELPITRRAIYIVSSYDAAAHIDSKCRQSGIF